jgi:hypothetical protein
MRPVSRLLEDSMKFLRRLSRFSLRTFFAMLLCVSLPVGWLSMQIGATQRETAVITKLSAIVGPMEDLRGQLRIAM